MIRAQLSIEVILMIMFTAIEQHDMMALSLLKKRAQAQSVLLCKGYRPPDREQYCPLDTRHVMMSTGKV